ncbi:hypothetical protein CEUSTIGMA_g9320.t1 [Chlamydomonas eustigma]|uniref:Uncharacterized protein n=1 Tax=Chlamydomonas eustigma TaxID=1157962 RepID=A0A250XG47_9CHLO|nr:hypothetical protein CEUSTIGMA_g9320.t1 [Chlamydomonas eustigma]|eukprot:GAX81892.1 hypothetical protein CEUSTIGMA_g9320.t1 [Chlamydomonas eustigma]
MRPLNTYIGLQSSAVSTLGLVIPGVIFIVKHCGDVQEKSCHLGVILASVAGFCLIMALVLAACLVLRTSQNTAPAATASAQQMSNIDSPAETIHQQIAMVKPSNKLDPGYPLVMPSSTQAMEHGNIISHYSNLLTPTEGPANMVSQNQHHQVHQMTRQQALTAFSQVYSAAAEQLQAHLTASRQILLGLLQPKHNPIASTAAATVNPHEAQATAAAAANRGSLLAAPAARIAPPAARIVPPAARIVPPATSSAVKPDSVPRNEVAPFFNWPAMGTVLPSTGRSGNHFYGMPTAPGHHVLPVPSTAPCHYVLPVSSAAVNTHQGLLQNQMTNLEG